MKNKLSFLIKKLRKSLRNQEKDQVKDSSKEIIKIKTVAFESIFDNCKLATQFKIDEIALDTNDPLNLHCLHCVRMQNQNMMDVVNIHLQYITTAPLISARYN